MNSRFEIERKFLVRKMPINLNNNSKLEIIQAYLSFADPCIRIRSVNNKYYMTLKNGMGIKRTELEKEINNKKIELDIFHNELDGLDLVEVEFATLEEAEQFKIPDWFGKEVTNDMNYTNSLLSKNGLE